MRKDTHQFSLGNEARLDTTICFELIIINTDSQRDSSYYLPTRFHFSLQHIVVAVKSFSDISLLM